MDSVSRRDVRDSADGRFFFGGPSGWRQELNSGRVLYDAEAAPREIASAAISAFVGMVRTITFGTCRQRVIRSERTYRVGPADPGVAPPTLPRGAGCRPSPLPTTANLLRDRPASLSATTVIVPRDAQIGAVACWLVILRCRQTDEPAQRG